MIDVTAIWKGRPADCKKNLGKLWDVTGPGIEVRSFRTPRHNAVPGNVVLLQLVFRPRTAGIPRRGRVMAEETLDCRECRQRIGTKWGLCRTCYGRLLELVRVERPPLGVGSGGPSGLNALRGNARFITVHACGRLLREGSHKRANESLLLRPISDGKDYSFKDSEEPIQ